MGSVEFAVPVLTGYTVAQALSIMQELGIAKGALVSIDGQPITDTMSAYVGKHLPEPFNEERKRMRIRAGQTMDLFLQMEKPVRDSAAANLPLPE